MKLKLDDQGHVVVQDGKPVYVHDDNKEIPFDASATLATISRLNGEAKGHRERAEASDIKLKQFEGIEDPAAARKAIETIKNIDASKLIDAGKVEEIKQAAIRGTREQSENEKRSLTEQLTALTGQNEKLTGQIASEKIGGSFTRSKLITDKFAIPADLVQARFGNQFKVEEGKVVAYDGSGNKIYSRARPGDLAEFDEALEILVDQYPYKDHILKGKTAAGSGANNGNDKGNGNKNLSRAQFNAMEPAERTAKMRDGFQVTD